MGKREVPFIPGEVPKRPSYPLLPKGSTIIPQTADNSGVASQEEALRNLRSRGYQGPLTKSEMEIQGNTPKPSKFPLLPEGRTIQAPGSYADTSGVQPQSEAIRNLRAQGYQGPLTQEELTGLRGSTFKRIHTVGSMQSPYQSEKSALAELDRNNQAESLKVFGLDGINESEIQKAYSAFKELASRNMSILDPSTDAYGISKRFSSKYGKIMRPTSGGNISDDELLDMFKQRYLAELELKNKEIPF
jgi:hypothetical protein